MSGGIPAGSEKHGALPLGLGLGTGRSYPMDETFLSHFPTLPIPALVRLGILGASLAVQKEEQPQLFFSSAAQSLCHNVDS